MNKAKLAPTAMLHPHIPVRQRIIYNVKTDQSAILYGCNSANLGCGWGQLIQVQGDIATSPVSVAAMKRAEQALLPKLEAPKESDVPVEG